MSTNYTKEIYDQLIDQIQSEFVRFKDRNRISVVKEFEDMNLGNMGYDDSIYIRPSTPNTLQQYTQGASVLFPFELLYLKRDYKDPVDSSSAFAENLDAHLRSITHNQDYWYHLSTEYDYNITDYLPEKLTEKNLKNLSGFVMQIDFWRYKSGSDAVEKVFSC